MFQGEKNETNKKGKTVEKLSKFLFMILHLDLMLEFIDFLLFRGID